MTDQPQPPRDRPARAPVFFTVPPNARAERCRGCPADIYWVRLESGKSMPVDVNVEGGQKPTASYAGRGVSHFATCPAAQNFRRRKD